jgi:hypothetical protein
MGESLVLLKAALSSLPPVYFLSFFKAPTCIISIIESLFKYFVWGEDGEARKYIGFNGIWCVWIGEWGSWC